VGMADKGGETLIVWPFASNATSTKLAVRVDAVGSHVHGKHKAIEDTFPLPPELVVVREELREEDHHEEQALEDLSHRVCALGGFTAPPPPVEAG
jgi:hypothetical protein